MIELTKAKQSLHHSGVYTMILYYHSLLIYIQAIQYLLLMIPLYPIQKPYPIIYQFQLIQNTLQIAPTQLQLQQIIDTISLFYKLARITVNPTKLFLCTNNNSLYNKTIHFQNTTISPINKKISLDFLAATSHYTKITF